MRNSPGSSNEKNCEIFQQSEKPHDGWVRCLRCGNAEMNFAFSQNDTGAPIYVLRCAKCSNRISMKAVANN
jgi:hypothetical protein